MRNYFQPRETVLGWETAMEEGFVFFFIFAVFTERNKTYEDGRGLAESESYLPLPNSPRKDHFLRVESVFVSVCALLSLSARTQTASWKALARNAPGPI